MAKDLEALVGRFVAEAEAAAGPALRGVVLYGSGAGGEYVPGRSDLNFLLVAERIDLSLLDGLQKKSGAWERRRIATPLVVDAKFLPSSADSYPLEILGMMASYRVLKGEDPFEGLAPQKEHVRLQVEREVKAKTLLLRRGYMESCGKHHRLLDNLVGALPAIQAILRGVLYLQGGDWKLCGAQLHQRCAERIGIEGGTLDAIHAARLPTKRPNRQATLELYGKTLEMLRSLAVLVDETSTSGMRGRSATQPPQQR
jgi:hypothetical protein